MLGWLIDGLLYFLAAFGLLSLITVTGAFVKVLMEKLGGDE